MRVHVFYMHFGCMCFAHTQSAVANQKFNSMMRYETCKRIAVVRNLFVEVKAERRHS